GGEPVEVRLGVVEEANGAAGPLTRQRGHDHRLGSDETDGTQDTDPGHAGPPSSRRRWRPLETASYNTARSGPRRCARAEVVSAGPLVAPRTPARRQRGDGAR